MKSGGRQRHEEERAVVGSCGRNNHAQNPAKLPTAVGSNPSPSVTESGCGLGDGSVF